VSPAEEFTVRAIRATPHARAWLASTTSALALHVFDAAIYARNQGGDVIAITSETIGTGPLALVVRTTPVPWTHLVAAGSPVEVSGGGLLVGRLSVDLNQVEDWDPIPAWGQLVLLGARLAARLRMLNGLVARISPAGSMAALLKDQAIDEPIPGSASAALRAAKVVMPILLQGLVELRRGSEAHLEEAAQRLAGLGGGFTPAGDDFLMGVIYAVWSSLEAERALRIGHSIAAVAAPLTTTVSGAYLQAAAAGGASAPWHDLVEALVGEDDGAIEAAVARLARIGHTSGADALAGFVTGLEALREPR
jgi:hypothetical protein